MQRLLQIEEHGGRMTAVFCFWLVSGVAQGPRRPEKSQPMMGERLFVVPYGDGYCVNTVDPGSIVKRGRIMLVPSASLGIGWGKNCLK